LAQQAREVAALTYRQIEDVLLEWLGYTVAVIAVAPA
jgi:hypothetical protein